MGGGTILILLLSIINSLDQHVAQATNLVFFIPTSIAAVITNVKEKNINFKLGFIIIIFGVIGACIGAVISNKLNVNILRKIFAVFLLFIAIYEIYSWYKEYIKNKNGYTKNNLKGINNKYDINDL